MNDMRWASIDAFAEQNRDNILRDITRLVAVPSVEGTPEPGAPFGAGPRAALDKALEIAGELGLDTFNADGYIGWAETGRIADGQKFIGTITHTDVVPEGNGWDADPYTVGTNSVSARPKAFTSAYRPESAGNTTAFRREIPARPDGQSEGRRSEQGTAAPTRRGPDI